jgi:hypothetical protein
MHQIMHTSVSFCQFTGFNDDTDTGLRASEGIAKSDVVTRDECD